MDMAQLTIRQVDQEIARLLKIRAAHNNRSAEAEVRAILERALRPDADLFWDRARVRREATCGLAGSDSAELIRQQRDRRAAAESEGEDRGAR